MAMFRSRADDALPFPPILPEADGRLHGGKLALVGGVLGLCLLALVGYRLFSREAKQGEIPPAPQPTESEVASQGEPVPDRSLNLPQGYGGWDRTAQVPPPPTPPSIPQAQQVWLPGQSATPTAGIPPLVQGNQGQGNGAPTPGGHGAGRQNGSTPRQPANGQPPSNDKPRRYMFATGTVAKSPFESTQEGTLRGAPSGPNGQGGAADSQKGSLIKDATWEKPADGTKVWYMSQRIHGITTEEVVSDIGGTMVIRVSRDLQDKFLQGPTLIPQHSLVVVQQTGQVQFGASRLDVSVKQVELPDGSILSPKAKLGDAASAQGLTGDVNYHWGRVLAGAGLSAILSIGTRLPTGSTQGFVPTIGQETTRQLGSDISQTGKKIVERELNVAPTITIPIGTSVTLKPDENISFSHGPKIIK
jgi:type IV secretory pathway VirB10-like protein